MRPVAGHGDPVRPVPGGQHDRRGAGLGRKPTAVGLVLSVQCGLAVLGAGETGACGRGAPRTPPALGADAIGRGEQHAAGRLDCTLRLDGPVESLRRGAAVCPVPGYRRNPADGPRVHPLPDSTAVGRSRQSRHHRVHGPRADPVRSRGPRRRPPSATDAAGRLRSRIACAPRCDRCR